MKMYIDPKLSSHFLEPKFKLSTDFYTNSKYMFKQTVVNMLKSTALNLPKNYAHNINKISENIAAKLIVRHLGQVQCLSVFSSFSDGFFYQGWFHTLFKFTSCDRLQLMIGYYGIETGHKMFDLMMKVTGVMAKAPAFKLMLIYLKVLIHFACKFGEPFDESESVLLMSLNIHLENISLKYEFSQDLALIIALVDLDHLRFTQHIIHCKAVDQCDIYFAN